MVKLLSYSTMDTWVLEVVNEENAEQKLTENETKSADGLCTKMRVNESKTQWRLGQCLLSATGWGARLVQAHGTAQPPCEIYFFHLRSLDKRVAH